MHQATESLKAECDKMSWHRAVRAVQGIFVAEERHPPRPAEPDGRQRVEAAVVFRDALKSLKSMHDADWLHRDLKPAVHRCLQHVPLFPDWQNQRQAGINRIFRWIS